jgi:hypothetical protein
MMIRTHVLAWLIVIGTSRSLLAQTATCAGDCNQDGVVRVNELIRLVKAVQGVVCLIAPNCPPPDPCLGLDVDGDGAISADELIFGVNRVVEAVGNCLSGCPVAP